ncbi:MAG: ATP-binding protein [Pseudomonadota bacterium]|nr:ATP-binding protein [Pseudomonadota bacterium]
MNIEKTRDLLAAFDFHGLFIELGWSQPGARRPGMGEAAGVVYSRRMIAQLAGVAVFEVWTGAGLPDRAGRDAIERDVARDYRENLCIFIDREHAASQSIWAWANRAAPGAQGEAGKPRRVLREHAYFRGQPADLFISKLQALFFELAEVGAIGNLTVVEVARRLKDALDVERVTKKFFRAYQQQHEEFIALIAGIAEERDRRWYASVILNRLMFVWFLQKKGFLDHDAGSGHGDFDYLPNKLEQSRARGEDRFFGEFLKALFFEAFAKPEELRDEAARALTGNIRYLNGGLFIPHRLEKDGAGEIRVGRDLRIPDRAFERLFTLFDAYSWNLDDTPGGKADEINPDVLGYIFEKYINQKAFGAYYTRPEITEYLCERTIHRLILARVNDPCDLPLLAARKFQTLPDLLLHLDAPLCHELLDKALPGLKLLDPACGSGAFLVAAMKTLVNIYSAIIGRIKFLGDKGLDARLKKWESEHKSLGYFIKRSIITDNLFGVDLMEEATEIARLRLFLALVASARTVEQLEPLPNIDFNILAGNSLVGLLRVEAHEFEARQDDLFRQSYRHILDEKNLKIDRYRHTVGWAGDLDLSALKADIEQHKHEAQTTLNDLLLAQWDAAGIRYEQATWDTAKCKEGRPAKRKLKTADIEVQRPFHWGFEFDDILHKHGGFDAIITNPPWEAFKPNAKEFFQEHSELVSKNKMAIEAFEKEQAKLLQDPAIRAAWLDYLSRFPHLNAWFRNASQYANQVAQADGKKIVTDLNLYKLFLEQCVHLLRPGGECGIVIPSGIYTDLGAKGLREMLFDENTVTGLFGFENRKTIFEGVHRSFKFVVLTFEKGGKTASFPAAFMRLDVEELSRFPAEGAIEIPVEVIKRLSPDAYAVQEFRNARDVALAEKLFDYPMLGDAQASDWRLDLRREFHMTDDAALYHAEFKSGRLPLVEGKMIHQFDAAYAAPRYWLDEAVARDTLMKSRIKQSRKRFEEAGRHVDPNPEKIRLDYESYRLAFRAVAASTNERTFIGAILPPGRFCPHSVSLESVFQEGVVRGKPVYNLSGLGIRTRLYLLAVLNSFVADHLLRQKVSANISYFFVYGLPVPRIQETDERFAPIATRAARLSCTTPEFDALAQEVGLERHRPLEPGERARLRAELDGLVAHLYGLTEEEFIHILATFPLVADPVKLAARNAYRDVEQGKFVLTNPAEQGRSFW